MIIHHPGACDIFYDFGEKPLLYWLGIATMLVSAGNFIAHAFLFNAKGKTVYNPGMLTAILLFLPASVAFFFWVIQHHAASPLDWIAGIVLGIALNTIGIFKTIDVMKNKNTSYIFPARCLLPGQQKAPAESA